MLMPQWWRWLVLPQRAKTYGFSSFAEYRAKSGKRLPRLASSLLELRLLELLLPP